MNSTMTLSKRMTLLAVGIVSVLVVLGGVIWYATSSVTNAVNANMERADQESTLAELETETISLTLNAMDAIIDRDSGSIDAELTSSMMERVKKIQEDMDSMDSAVDTPEEIALAKEARSEIEELLPLVEIEIPKLVAAYGDTANDREELELRSVEIDDHVDEHKTAALQATNKILSSIRIEVDEASTSMISSLAKTTTLLIVMILLAIIGVIVTFIVFIRSINKALGVIVAGLTDGASQVNIASQQVSQSSQQMAEGASEQASSLEEISSSLEEMTSMTRQNTENAKLANSGAMDAQKAAEKGSQAMTRMNDAINKIKLSADQTAKILKTIDEIAFQTNLLALNAAVEAARAGEAGKGFAVVAEEVRNLAKRSAEAAKSTAELIEESRTNADNGVEVTREVGGILEEIAVAARKVNQLASEVAAASDEQAQGISQVATAVTQMDKVTQTSAANAEESASASEELSSQAAELYTMVDTLVALVGNASDNNGKRSKPHTANATATIRKVLPAHTPVKRTITSKKATKPSDVIPLDDSFDEF